MAAVMPADPLDQLMDSIHELVDRFRESMGEQPYPCNSRSLAFALEAGLPARMAYTVADTARYTGISTRVLRAENEAGRLAFVRTPGAERGSLIRVDEMDRWMEEHAA